MAQSSITFQVITSAISPIVTWSDLFQREKVVTGNRGKKYTYLVTTDPINIGNFHPTKPSPH